MERKWRERKRGAWKDGDAWKPSGALDASVWSGAFLNHGEFPGVCVCACFKSTHPTWILVTLLIYVLGHNFFP